MIVAHPVAPTPAPTTAAEVSRPEDEGDAVAPAHSAALRHLFSSADRESFNQLQASLGGRVGLAVGAMGRDRRVWGLGSLSSGVAWSTSKLPVAMAVIDAGQASAQQQSLVAAITASDNDAAARLWNALGGGDQAAQAADAELRAAGDHITEVESRQLRPEFSAFGQTNWSLRDQAKFAAGMGCSDSGRQVLHLMGQVISSQRWGLGAVGVPAQFKGGWGPGVEPGVNGGYFDRQLGVLDIHGHHLAAAIAALPSDGSHETATGELTAVGRWLVSHANVDGLPRDARC